MKVKGEIMSKINGKPSVFINVDLPESVQRQLDHPSSSLSPSEPPHQHAQLTGLMKATDHVESEKLFKTHSGFEFSVSKVTSVSGTFEREYGKGKSRKIDFIVYVEIEGVEHDGIIASNRIAADAYRNELNAAIKDYKESKMPAKAEESIDNRRRVMKGSFAIIRELFPDRQSEDDAWAFLMKGTGKVSRRNLTEKEFVIIFARLQACQNSPAMLLSFKCQIADWKKERGKDNADTVGTGNPEYVRVFSITKDEFQVHTLIEQKRETRGNVLAKCQDYADENEVDLLIVYPGDASNLFIESRDPKETARIREQNASSDKKQIPCTQCGSISCSGRACRPNHPRSY